MKKVAITIVTVLVFNVLQAQKEHFWFLSVAQDVKMSYEGPQKYGGVLNPEITLGIEWKKWITGIRYEWLSHIDYQKWTYLSLDYKAINTSLFKKDLSMIIGVELSVIYRDSKPDVVKTTNYRRWEPNLSAGLNAQINYWVTQDVAIMANTNYFKAEKYDNLGNRMKPMRFDVRVGVIYKIL